MRRPRPKLGSPLLPDGVEVVVPPPPYEACTLADKLLAYSSSLIVVGSPLWFYGGIAYLYGKWRRYRALASLSKSNRFDAEDDFDICMSSGESSQERPDVERRRAGYERIASRYGAAIALVLLISIWGPHRSTRIGEWLNVRRWRLWDAWLNYVGFTVLRDSGDGVGAGDSKSVASSRREFDMQSSPAIFAFVPHGIFPFNLAMACLSRRGSEETWGSFPPVVATATRLFPLVRMFIAWLGGVDASRSAVSSALSRDARRVGLSPGGIAEMFESYPKPGFHPNDEAALLRHRNGIFKLALKHGVPVVPVYCFGATKMFRRVQLPRFVETLSRVMKISLCILFGKLGLPIPFRQRMVYVIGNTIWPLLAKNGDGSSLSGQEFNAQVKEMHDAFCNEITRIFDRNKAHYGWENKTLRIV